MDYIRLRSENFDSTQVSVCIGGGQKIQPKTIQLSPILAELTIKLLLLEYISTLVSLLNTIDTTKLD